MAKNTERIAVYGKGGVGKSVIATSLSMSYALSGLRVLHVGCDPKHDSSFRLLDEHQPLRTVLDALGDDLTVHQSDFLNRGRYGIDCCEAGGPSAGLGCGGRGVARTIELIEDVGLLRNGEYDVAVFDVLGDVVCGGFAAPLRHGFAQKVVIVASEEPMALYAANNIARAIETYRFNGVGLAGVVLNERSDGIDRPLAQVYCETIGTSVLTTLHRDPQILEAERQGRTVIEHAPSSVTSKALRELSKVLIGMDLGGLSRPCPMSDHDFFRFLRSG